MDGGSTRPWSDGGSQRYMWTEVGLERAIEYVVNGQDGPIPELHPAACTALIYKVQRPLGSP